MHDMLRKLEGGDRRSIGRSNEVVKDVIANPKLFGALFHGLRSPDPLVRMRSADALEKITVQHPQYLRPYKAMLIGEVARSDQKEVRWHVAQLLPRVEWDTTERDQVVSVLMEYMSDTSSIVKTFAMQALFQLARQFTELLPMVTHHLQEQTIHGTPAMKARGRKLLAELRGLTRRSTRGTAKAQSGK